MPHTSLDLDKSSVSRDTRQPGSTIRQTHLVISRWTGFGADALDQTGTPGLRPRVQGQTSVVPVAYLDVSVGAVRHELIVQNFVPEKFNSVWRSLFFG